jgi:hypothetical protein
MRMQDRTGWRLAACLRLLGTHDEIEFMARRVFGA